jgi:hypothetical protein
VVEVLLGREAQSHFLKVPPCPELIPAGGVKEPPVRGAARQSAAGRASEYGLSGTGSFRQSGRVCDSG